MASVTFYSGPGWRVSKSGAVGGPVNGTQIGSASSTIDLLCDGVVDKLADSSSSFPAAPVAEQFWKVTTNWGPNSETTYGGTPAYPNPDGSYLNSIMPPATVAERINRARADMTTVFVGTDGSVVPAAVLSLTDTLPLNAVWFHPIWSPGGSTTGTNANTESEQPC